MYTSLQSRVANARITQSHGEGPRGLTTPRRCLGLPTWVHRLCYMPVTIILSNATCIANSRRFDMQSLLASFSSTKYLRCLHIYHTTAHHSLTPHNNQPQISSYPPFPSLTYRTPLNTLPTNPLTPFHGQRLLRHNRHRQTKTSTGSTTSTTIKAETETKLTPTYLLAKLPTSTYQLTSHHSTKQKWPEEPTTQAA